MLDETTSTAIDCFRKNEATAATDRSILAVGPITTRSIKSQRPASGFKLRFIEEPEYRERSRGIMTGPYGTSVDRVGLKSKLSQPNNMLSTSSLYSRSMLNEGCFLKCKRPDEAVLTRRI